MLVFPLVFPNLFAAASTLKLQGSDSHIVFASGTANSATLTASCGAKPASVQYLVPRTFYSYSEPTTIRARLKGVPATCTFSDIDDACATVDADYPPLFVCTWLGTTGNTTTGPFRANISNEVKDEALLAHAVDLYCPTPTLEQMLSTTGPWNSGGHRWRRCTEPTGHSIRPDCRQNLADRLLPLDL